MEPFYQDPTGNKIYNGDALAVLKTLPDESVQMCMTSPPYWGLRNYAGGSDLVWGGDENCEHIWGEGVKKGISGGKCVLPGAGRAMTEARYTPDTKYGFCTLCSAWRGQLGLEPTPELYVKHLMMIFQETKRVLRKDGSFYLNIGDTYVSSPTGSQGTTKESWHRPSRNESEQSRKIANRQFDIKTKCMVCIPERVLFAMLEDGWILRNKIIWHKPNAMPSSVKDRFTATWEYLYFFTKAKKYYFDLDAVRIPHTTQSLERYQRGVNLDRPAIGKSAEVGPMQQYKRSPQWFQEMFPPDADYKGKFDDLFGHRPQPQSFNLRVRDVKRGKKGVSAQGGELKASEKEIERYQYPENPRDILTERQENIVEHFEQKGSGGHYLYGGLESPEGIHKHPKGKNPGDYWNITTQPSSIYVCPKCEGIFPRHLKVCPSCKIEGVVGHFAPYPVFLCEAPIKASTKVGDVVLDPLAGGGNTGVAAKMLGRKCILIDCVKEYCIMARYKLSKIEYQPELEVKHD